MHPPKYRVRRATLDDLGALKALWESMRFPDSDLERRLTEFQIAESEDGKLLGALALQINARQGRMHSEAFTDFALAEELRPALWERVQSVAMNHGLARLWTQERAPFWSRCGLQPASGETLQKLPAGWSNQSSDWLTLQLRDETAIISFDKEFALFKEAEKRRTQNALRYAKTLKRVATVIAIILALFVIAAILRLVQQNTQQPGR
jgi:N-acetylglutamate synthase-like GNAT family acetyltransferase